ncbi:hypothetical protein HPP92_011049 [Vanilla planifolia]|uniref:Uncharacterized protein n=1 Tax=Vanilla planifolia TaxID=51239 RepID=A0A835V428_VANPL|nr:hypothetical protein HPP92_011049 [Vanilla planifolia]
MKAKGAEAESAPPTKVGEAVEEAPPRRWRRRRRTRGSWEEEGAYGEEVGAWGRGGWRGRGGGGPRVVGVVGRGEGRGEDKEEANRGRLVRKVGVGGRKGRGGRGGEVVGRRREYTRRRLGRGERRDGESGGGGLGGGGGKGRRIRRGRGFEEGLTDVEGVAMLEADVEEGRKGRRSGRQSDRQRW